jgi:hypothetical protein
LPCPSVYVKDWDGDDGRQAITKLYKTNCDSVARRFHTKKKIQVGFLQILSCERKSKSSNSMVLIEVVERVWPIKISDRARTTLFNKGLVSCDVNQS